MRVTRILTVTIWTILVTVKEKVMSIAVSNRKQNANLVSGRSKNIEVRSREYLTLDEVDVLLTASRSRGRHQVRDYALLLLMFRHGLRVSEAIGLRWDAVMFEDRTINVTRLKKSESGVHPLQLDEVVALQALREITPRQNHLFMGERGKPLSRHAVAKILERCADLAGLTIDIHPHMLRHACGYYLANQGLDTRLIQDWLGHRNIQHTVRYTKLNPERFKEIAWG